METPLPNLLIHIDRDSVHPADDIFSHAETIQMPTSTTLGDFLALMSRSDYLPGVRDGWTWTVEMISPERRFKGVLNASLATPLVVLPLDSRVDTLFNGAAPSFNFRHHHHVDPAEVFKAIQDGSYDPFWFGRDKPIVSGDD